MTPRLKTVAPWTWDDHLDSEQKKQRAADRRSWDCLARRFGLRGRDITALLARFMDDRIREVLRAQPQLLTEQLTNPAQADELRNALGVLMCEDIAEMVQILTSKGCDDDTGDPEEIA